MSSDYTAIETDIATTTQIDGYSAGYVDGAASGGGSGPVSTSAPTDTGSTDVGSVRTGTAGTWSGNGSITYTYQRYRDGVAISGATSLTYTLVLADAGTVHTFAVTATDADGSATREVSTLIPSISYLIDLLTDAPYATENAGTLSSGDHASGTLAAGAAQTIPQGYTRFWRFDTNALKLTDKILQTLVQAQFPAVLTGKNGLAYAIFVCDSDGTGTGADGMPTQWSEVGAVIGPVSYVVSTGTQRDALILATAGATDVALGPTGIAAARRMMMDYQWRSSNAPGAESNDWRAFWRDETGAYVHTRGDTATRTFNTNAPLAVAVCIWRYDTVAAGGEAFSLDHLFATVATDALAVP